MKNIYILLPLIFLFFISTSINAESEFDAYKQQQENGFHKQKNEFAAYKKKLLGEFDRYRKQTEAVWGRKHNVMPGNTNLVSYPGSLSNRSVVDYKNGTVDVSVAIDNSKHVSDSEARKRLDRAVLATLKQGPDLRPMSQLARHPVSKSMGAPLLKNLVAGPNGKPLPNSDYNNFSAEQAKNAKLETIRGADGKTRTIYHTQFQLVPDQIRVRAERFQKSVDENARQQKISPALVFAVIETESMFNPYARSPAPAFGLMQLVPTSGAREAYRYLHNRDRVVSDTYLFNANNNIELGAAYLNRLYHSHLAEIHSPKARIWATIAAYNTGPGNVLRSFAGRYSRARFGSHAHWKQVAFEDINRRTPEQVFRYMREHLPYAETRRYIEKVRTKMPKYQEIQAQD